MRNFYLIMLLTLSTMVFSACNKDKDLDDYKVEKVQSDLAELKTIEGSYSGYLTSKKNPNVNLGALMITLTATTESVPGGEGTDLQAVLSTEIELMGQYKIILSSDRSSYISETGSYNSIKEIDVYEANGKTIKKKIQISGIANGSTLAGSMKILGDKDEGGIFNLQMNGPSTDELHARRKPESPLSSLPRHIFAGTAINSATSGAIRTVQLVVENPLLDTNVELYQILVPSAKRAVQGQLVFGSGSNTDKVIFNSGTWDKQNGILQLKGSSVVSGGNIAIDMDCRNFYYEMSKYNFSCSYHTGLTSIDLQLNFVKE